MTVISFEIYPCFPRLDSYPQLYDCSHPYEWNEIVTSYHSYHTRVNPSEPFYIPGISVFSLYCFEINVYDIPEFQGGSFDQWGLTAPGI